VELSDVGFETGVLDVVVDAIGRVIVVAEAVLPWVDDRVGELWESTGTE